MSCYESWRFKCIIKEEYRKDFGGIALNGDWANSLIKELRDYAEEFLPIPNFQCDVPQKWAGCDKEGQPFQTSWNEQTGE